MSTSDMVKVAIISRKNSGFQNVFLYAVNGLQQQPQHMHIPPGFWDEPAWITSEDATPFFKSARASSFRRMLPITFSLTTIPDTVKQFY
jgi:hypothetical protein